MSTETAATRDRQHLTVGTLARRALAAVVAADAVNATITFAASAAGVAPNLDSLSFGSVLSLTTLGVLGAAVVYGLLDRSVANPDRTFVRVAAVVLVLSWIPDVIYVPTEPGGTTAGAVVLATMHLTTAVIAVAFLTDRYAPALLD